VEFSHTKSHQNYCFGYSSCLLVPICYTYLITRERIHCSQNVDILPLSDLKCPFRQKMSTAIASGPFALLLVNLLQDWGIWPILAYVIILASFQFVFHFRMRLSNYAVSVKINSRIESNNAKVSSASGILMSVRNWIMVVLCTVQLGNQSLSLLTVCRMRRCALVLEQSERLYIWKRENFPVKYDVNNCVYNISVNSNQIRATLLSIVYLELASDTCLRLDQIPSPHLVSD